MTHLFKRIRTPILMLLMDFRILSLTLHDYKILLMKSVEYAMLKLSIIIPVIKAPLN